MSEKLGKRCWTGSEGQRVLEGGQGEKADWYDVIDLNARSCRNFLAVLRYSILNARRGLRRVC